MLCDKCKKYVATFHEKVTINGEGYETHLCSKCANLTSLSPFDVFNVPYFNDEYLLEETKKCPNCKSTFFDFLKNGKLGCKQCYDTFEIEIRDMLENMESPIDFDLNEFLDSDKNPELVKLEEEFNKAIEEERYEDAGKLKEKIKQLNNLEGEVK